MEQTMGKRIAAGRKSLGLTQDQIAEKLGVTAQAVSKWENDQSCPDITMIPRLAELFGISTDELLGVQRQEVHPAQLVDPDEEQEPEGIHFQGGNWEMQWDGDRKNGLGLAAWVLLTGALLLVGNILGWNAGLWDILWPTGLMIFGICGLWPRFSVFRLGCGLLGGYFLLCNLELIPFRMGKNQILPVLLLLFGLSLLMDALKKPKGRKYHVVHDGKAAARGESFFQQEEEAFRCATSFGENTREIGLPRLTAGEATVSFGELRVDLTRCEEIADGTVIRGKCSFGQLVLIVPRTCKVDPHVSTTLGALETQGNPDPDASVTIRLEGGVSFGQIEVRYV